MSKRPLTVTINLVIILLYAVLWLVLGILIATGTLPGMPDLPGTQAIMALVSVVMAVLIITLAFFLHKHSRVAYILTLIFFTLTSALTIFDDFGLVDAGFLLLSLLPVILLILDRKWYLAVKSETHVFQ